MKFKTYLRTWEGIQGENKWGRLIQAGLLIIVLLLVIKVFTKETIVTMQPFTLTEEAWVTQNNASRSYKEAWGFALSLLLGNVTPGSVDFVKERLSPMLSPEIYQDVIDAIEIQSKQIKEDRVTMRFEPRFVEYEEKSDKIFAYGYSYVKGSSSQQEERGERTYEFVLKIANYAPSIDYMETYMGKPRTKAVLEQLKRKEEEKERRTNEAQR
ncbi:MULTISPECIES: TraE/TraK family type IV conjugative transfer system protein [Aeromonas]|uniref:Conjugal transfer pilus assembly protein TraE n=1 Tax=Aeromonas salmonicida TaxID=645 RepID=A0AAX1PCU3_AERSA|nr:MULTISPECIES: TraE/TraK family type IV conjugative transfer system protein [Aeromonas]MDU4190314.1 TraE/TraK family type IV conjugative transfer system protein [Aeromonas sp.]RAI98827.1 conjugal transfer pilus assembly protein TraE [Aeromonas salmonicida]